MGKITDRGSIRGDEYCTREQDAEIIAQHIIRPMKVWLPFNDRGKAFEKVLTRHGHECICTDTDFFLTEPPEGTQAVISNPPFSKKKDVVKRLDELNLKFALIIPILWLNDGVPFDYANQIMFFRKRMRFLIDEGGGRTQQTENKLYCAVKWALAARLHDNKVNRLWLRLKCLYKDTLARSAEGALSVMQDGTQSTLTTQTP